MTDETSVEAPVKPKGVYPGTRRVGPPGNAIPVPWQDIQTAIAAGLSSAKVAKQFAEYHPEGWEKLHSMIRKRAQREKWMVPATAMAKARQQMQDAGYEVPSPSQRGVTALRDPEKTVTLVTESLEEMGKEGSLIAGQLSLSLLRDASKNSKRIAPILDAKDIATSVKTLRLVAGMDKQGPVVAMALWGQAHVTTDVTAGHSVTGGQADGDSLDWDEL